ncbi:MAG TPA: hypothetical protein VLA68_05500 [Nitrososphaera sp.]|nr:hypothetical protein [Nitrososphaera sp.]HEX2014664.1 hypothetical protein [Nitrososphaera sp.]
MRFGRRQATGIVGMALAVGGGVAWFFGQPILAFMSWAAAFIVMLRLNKKKKR